MPGASGLRRNRETVGHGLVVRPRGWRQLLGKKEKSWKDVGGAPEKRAVLEGPAREQRDVKLE